MSLPLSRIRVQRKPSKTVTTPRGERVTGVVYIPLPRDMWEDRTGDKAGYLDTLALSQSAQGEDTTWMVHRPDLHVEGDEDRIYASDGEDDGGDPDPGF